MEPKILEADTLEAAQHFIFVTQVYFCFCSNPAHIAMYAVVIWDWVISLPREYRFIWRTHWTPVKAAYLFCRYWVIAVVPYLLYCFVSVHSKETCEKIFKIPVALAMWNQVGSESVLLIRTYAFFNRNVYILWFLISAIAGVVAYQLYVDTSQMLLLPFVTPPFDRGPCFPVSKPHSAHLLGFFIAPLLFDTVVTFMTVWKAFTIRRRNGGPNSRLIQTFLREGVFYYLLISVANLVNGVFYLQPRQVISAINIPLSVMLGPILACRLILDLRERGSETVSHSEGTGMAAFSVKSGPQHGSPFTPGPEGYRSKSHSGNLAHSRTRNTICSNVLLSTLGSIPAEVDADPEHDAVRVGLESLHESTTTALEDDECHMDAEDHSGTPAPAYNSLEMGFKAARPPSLEIPSGVINGIRVDVEKTTSTM